MHHDLGMMFLEDVPERWAPHIQVDEREPLAPARAFEVRRPARREVVDRDDARAVLQETIADMRAHESGPTGHKYDPVRHVGHDSNEAPSTFREARAVPATRT
jgi:hypothetical protein